MFGNSYCIVTKWRQEFRFCASDFTMAILAASVSNGNKNLLLFRQFVCFQGYFTAAGFHHLKGIQ